MKQLSITIAQEGFSYSMNYKGDFNKADELDKMKGTALKALFDTVKLHKDIGLKSIKLNKPVDLIIESEGRVISTFDVDESHRVKLKVGNTFKAKQRYAKVFIRLIDHMLEKKSPVGVNEAIASID